MNEDVFSSNKNLYECYFITDEEDKDKYKCRECEKTLTQRKGTGYANLVSHVKSAHTDSWRDKVRSFVKSAHTDSWRDKFRSFVNGKNINGPMDKFVKQPSPKAKNIYGWLEWIIEDNLPLTFCNKVTSKKYANLNSITTKTLKTYMRLVNNYAFKKIRERAPKSFGLIIDGWTIGSEHYYAIFMTWTDTTNGIDTVVEHLIYFGVAEGVDEATVFEHIDEEFKHFGLTAADWFDVICDALNEALGLSQQDENYVSLENFSKIVKFISMDNCSTNRKLSIDSGSPMVGCASHRLNLAVQKMLGAEEKRNRDGIITIPASQMQLLVRKVDLLMGELKTLKNSALLRTQTFLQPERRNATRWSSLFQMLLKWQRLRLHVAAVNNFADKVNELTPSSVENRMLDEFTGKLKDFVSVSKLIQSGGEKRKYLYEVKALFRKLVEDYGEEFALAEIKQDADIVLNKHFENGIAKIQACNEEALSQQEKAAVKIFLRPTSRSEASVEEKEDDSELSYVEQAVRAVQSQKRQRTYKSKYRPTGHVSPTANIVERFNSQAKLIMSDRRKSMNPDTLNMILILKATSK